MKLKGKGVWRRILKVVALVVAAIIGVTILGISAAVWILTPERLTPLIEDTANEYLDARVELGRAELSFWKTFPRVEVAIDDLKITSNAFAKLSPEERAKLPADADSLLYMKNFKGYLNIPYLFIVQIRLDDLELGTTRVNAVALNDSIANYNIVPISEEEEESSTSMPDIAINRFDITDKVNIKYVSIADTLNLDLDIAKSRVLTEGKPGYEIKMNSDLQALLPPYVKYNNLPVNIDGVLVWKHHEAQKLKLDDFTTTVGDLTAQFSSTLDFGEPMKVETFDMTVGPTKLTDLLKFVPEEMMPDLGDFTTDMTVKATATLTEPYILTDDALPMVDMTLDIPTCSATYDGYKLDKFVMNLTASVNGKNLDLSTARLNKFEAKGDGVEIKMTGSATGPIADPGVDASLKGSVDFKRLPKSILSMIPGTLTGKVTADAQAKLHLEDLSLARFHRIKLKGDIDLSNVNLSMPMFDIDFYTHLTELKFGTNDSYINDTQRIDSLLTASIKIDTMAVNMSGLTVGARDLKAGVGCKNASTLADTTTITPIGAKIYASRFTYSADDSTLVHLRVFNAAASLQRYEGQAQVPKLTLEAGLTHAFYADKVNRLLLRDGSLNIEAHIRPMSDTEKIMKARYDSIALRNPGLPQDSLITMLRKSSHRNHQHASMSDFDIINYGIDGQTKQLLMRWDVSGSLKAKDGGMFTPYFPVRNRLSNVNLKFSTDSIVFKKVQYNAGHSDFLISGGIRNMRSALLANHPLMLSLKVTSDTLNINELVQAAYSGAAFAESIDDGSVKLAQVESQAALDKLAQQAATTDSTVAVLIPMNISANIGMSAKNVIYADVLMHDFKGDVKVNNGSVNLHNLSASSDIGSAKLSALYTAPTKRDIQFGFGLQINNMHIKEFINMIPAVDSIMPLLRDFSGIVDADIAATTDVDSTMNVILPSLNAAVKLSGRDLVLLDAETFRTIAKWLLFKDKKTNVISSMNVEMIIADSRLELFPFVFDFDRYRLAVMGSNDLALNYKYHISVLKSPIPFKFGLNLSGNPDKMKVRLGRSKYKADQAIETIALVDTTRVNLLNEIDRVFNRGVRAARLGKLDVKTRPETINFDEAGDTISREDSLLFINEGILPKPTVEE